MSKIYNTVYKITNLLNDMIYIGVHETDNLDDNYLGSGKHIRRAIEKYGAENFKKDILSLHESIEEMYQKEATLVTQEFVDREDTYNIKLGGDIPPSNAGMTLPPASEHRKRAIGIANSGKNNGMFGKIPHNKGKVGLLGELNGMFGKEVLATEKVDLNGFILRYGEIEGTQLYNERSKKISKSKLGENNPMYGQLPWNKNTSMLQEIKDKVSASCKGKKKPRTAEHQAKLVASRKKNNTYKVSQKTKDQISRVLKQTNNIC